MDAFFYLGVALAALGVVFVWTRIISSISRIMEVGESRITVKPLLGIQRDVRVTEVVDLRLVSFLGIQTHATLRLQPTRFWSLAHSSFIFPVRGRFMDQQGPLKELWNRVPTTEGRL